MTDPTISLSFEDFLSVKTELIKALTTHLNMESEMNDFDVKAEEDDLWNTPVVDSKSVVKLSPIVEKMTGHKIKPEWIKPGGYNSVDEAIKHLIEQLELDLQQIKEPQGE